MSLAGGWMGRNELQIKEATNRIEFKAPLLLSEAPETPLGIYFKKMVPPAD